MKTILLGLAIFLLNFSALECGAQTSKLPKEMPEKVEIRYMESGGMLPEYTKITIAGNTLSVEEKKSDNPKPRNWTAKIPKEEQENLYRLFVENKFDTIKNDKTEGTVYDAGAEGVYINAGVGLNFNVSYGPNSPLSGRNQSRYLAISKAILELRSKYQSSAAQNRESNIAVLEYDPDLYRWQFKNAQKAALSDDEINDVRKLIQKAVGENNSKQKNTNRIINDLEKYKFQLIPVINENGEKEIWVNAFCADFEQDWKTQIIMVKDGGKCFFQFYLNLTKNTYDRFSMNGEA